MFVRLSNKSFSIIPMHYSSFFRGFSCTYVHMRKMYASNEASRPIFRVRLKFPSRRNSKERETQYGRDRQGEKRVKDEHRAKLSSAEHTLPTFYLYFMLGSLKLKVPRRYRCQVESLQKLPRCISPPHRPSFRFLLPSLYLLLSSTTTLPEFSSSHQRRQWQNVTRSPVFRYVHSSDAVLSRVPVQMRIAFPRWSLPPRHAENTGFRAAWSESQPFKTFRRRGCSNCPLDIRPTCKFTVFLPSHSLTRTHLPFLFYRFLVRSNGLHERLVPATTDIASNNVAKLGKLFAGNRDSRRPLRKRSRIRCGRYCKRSTGKNSTWRWDFFQTATEKWSDWTFCMCEGGLCKIR